MLQVADMLVITSATVPHSNERVTGHRPQKPSDSCLLLKLPVSTVGPDPDYHDGVSSIAPVHGGYSDYGDPEPVAIRYTIRFVFSVKTTSEQDGVGYRLP